MENVVKSKNLIVRIFCFYRDGFRNMTVGKVLWTIILVKLIVLFAVVKLFFFPNTLNTNFETDVQRADHVAKELVLPVKDNGNIN